MILPRQKDCARCNLCTGVATSIGIPSRWLAPPRHSTCIVWLGQNPGQNEDKQATCFVGRSGQLLTSDAYIGTTDPSLSLADHLLTNSVRCWSLNNAPPTVSQMRACAPYTLADLSSLPHTRIAIVCLGRPAVEALDRVILPRPIGPRSLSDATSTDQGTIRTLPSGRTVHCFATYHPAYCLRKPNAIKQVSHHLAVLKMWLTLASLDPPRLRLNPNPLTLGDPHAQ